MVFPLEYISLLNIAVVCFFVLYLFVGLKKGFLIMLIDLLGTIVVFLLAYFISPLLVKFYDFGKFFNIDLGYDALNIIINERINTLCWFLLVFIIGSLVLLLVKPIVKVIGNFPIIKEINGLLGGIFGLIKAYVLVLIFIFVLTTPIMNNGSIVINNSVLKPIYDSTAMVSSIFKDPTRINQIFQDIENGNILDEEKLNELQEWINNNFKDIKIDDFVNDNNE